MTTPSLARVWSLTPAFFLMLGLSSSAAAGGRDVKIPGAPPHVQAGASYEMAATSGRSPLRLSLATSGTGTLERDGLVCVRFDWARKRGDLYVYRLAPSFYDAGAPADPATHTAARPPACPELGPGVSWVSLTRVGSSGAAMTAAAPRDGWSPPSPKPDPLVSTHTDAKSNVWEFAVDGTGTRTLPAVTGLPFGGGGQPEARIHFRWGRDLRRSDHIHVLETAKSATMGRLNGFWFRPGTTDDGTFILAAGGRGASRFNYAAAPPAGVVSTDMFTRWSFEGQRDSGSGSVRYKGFGDPPDCTAQFRYERSEGATYRLSGVTGGCAEWIVSEGMRLESFTLDGQWWLNGTPAGSVR